MTRKLIAVLFVACAMLGARADTWTDPETGYTWTYRLNNDGAEIYGSTRAPSISPTPTNAVIIPATLGGKSVTCIGACAFYGCSGLKGVVIPDSVTEIGSSSFYGCSGLTSIVLPDSVESIYSAFSGCSNLLSVTIPQYICSEWSHFRYVFMDQYASITNVTFGAGVTNIAHGLFEECNELIFDTTTISGVKLVDGWAVGYDEKLSGELDLTGIRGIAEGAFWGCTLLTHVKIPEGVETIGQSAFYYCAALRSVQIPSTLKRVGGNAFAECYGISAVVIKDIDAWCRIEFDQGANPLYYARHLYLGDQLVRKIDIPADLSVIGPYQFEGGSSITNVTLPRGLQQIGSCCFNDCKGLTEIRIPTTVTNIASDAFYGCESLEAVHIDDIKAWCRIEFENWESNPLTYAKHLFIGEELLVSVEFPDGTRDIKPYLFSNCEDLTYVVVPNSVECIGEYVFSGCVNLQNVWIEGNAPAVSSGPWGYGIYDGTPKTLTTHVPEGSTGWLFMGSAELPESWPQDLYSLGRPIVHGIRSLCEISYDANGGSGGFMTNQMFGTATIVPTVSRDGCVFKGWLPSVPDFVPIQDSAIYVAQWECRVSFDPNGGSPVESSWEDLTRSVDVDTAIGEMPVVKRVGYQFCGWFLSPEDGEEVTSTTVITTNCTLYAHWRMPAVSVSAKQEQASAKGKCDVSPKGEIVLGQAIALSAKVQNANTVFAYWIDANGAIVGYSKKISVHPAEDESYQAVFRLKSKCARPVFDKNCEYGIDGYASTNNMVGVAFKAQMTVNRESYPVTFSAKGLPKGLKINASTGVIDGVPTKAGTFVATITAKSAANAKLKASTKKLRITIANLPAWARGSFGGYVFNGEYDYSSDSHIGPVSLTVSSTGKISGKLIVGGTNWTLTANSYSVESDSGSDRHYFVANGTAMATIGKITLKAPWQMSGRYYGSYGIRTTFLGSLHANGSVIGFKAIRNNWKDSSAQDELAMLVGVYDWITESGDIVTLTVNESGVVKVAGVFRDGRRIVSASPLLYVGNTYSGWLSVFVYSPAQTVVSVRGGRTEVSSLPAFFKEVVVASAPPIGNMENDVAYRRQGVRPLVDGTSTGSGSFTYSIPYGQAPSNTTVTVTAVPSKDSVFAYWLLDGEIVSYSTSCGVIMGDGDFTGLTAVFRSTASITENPEMPYMLGDDPFTSLSVGVPFQAQVEIDPKCRPVKFVAKNLPAGLSLNATTGAISGVPTEAGSKTISIMATSVTKPNLTSPVLKVPVFVEDLPAWAKGTFNGYVMGGSPSSATDPDAQERVPPRGLATVTVSSVGKISGKFYEGGTNWTFSAASYTAATSAAAPAQSGETPLLPGGATSAAAGFVCSNVVAKYAYKVTETVKGKKKTVTKYVERTFHLAVSPVPIVSNVPDVPDASIRGVVQLVEAGGRLGEAALPGEAGTVIEAWQNLWGRADYKALGKRLFTSTSGKKTFAYTTYNVEVCTNDLGQVSYVKAGDDKTGLTRFAALSLKVTSAGAVTATLTYDTGKSKKDPKTKKMVKVIYKPSCQSVVVPLVAADAETFAGEVPLYFAPSAGNGFEGLAGSVVVQ